MIVLTEMHGEEEKVQGVSWRSNDKYANGSRYYSLHFERFCL